MKSSELETMYQFLIDCPYCGEENDLAESDHDDDGVYSRPIFNNSWCDLVGEEVECKHCGNSFKISSVEN
jgi:uncharacterized Zn-finger protein